MNKEKLKLIRQKAVALGLAGVMGSALSACTSAKNKAATDQELYQDAYILNDGGTYYFGIDGVTDADYLIPEQRVELEDIVDLDKLTEENWKSLFENTEERNNWLDKNIQYPISYLLNNDNQRELELYTVNNETSYYLGYRYDSSAEELIVFDILAQNVFKLDNFADIQIVKVADIFPNKQEISRSELLEYIAQRTEEKTLKKVQGN